MQIMNRAEDIQVMEDSKTIKAIMWITTLELETTIPNDQELGHTIRNLVLQYKKDAAKQ